MDVFFSLGGCVAEKPVVLAMSTDLPPSEGVENHGERKEFAGALLNIM